MALTKDKKSEVIGSVKELLGSSKMTVVATYKGASVKDMQRLRREAKASGTKVIVVKNRLVIQALKQLDQYKDLSTDSLEGMLAYAFNDTDEVTAAQNLANFAKTNPTIEFVGAISPDGVGLEKDKVTALSALPTKTVLIASVVSLLGSPIRSTISALGSQLPAIVSGLEAKTS